MGFFLSPLGRVIGVGALCALLASGVSIWATSVYYRSDIAGLKLDAANVQVANSQEALVQFESATQKIALAATNYATIQETMGTKFDSVLKDFRNVKFKIPLAPDCKPDVDRLRSLSAAVTAANSYATAGQ
jgi:hypothetical protein